MKKQTFKRMAAFAAALVIAMGLLAGCGQQNSESSRKAESGNSSQAAVSQAESGGTGESTPEAAVTGYPIVQQDTVTLRYWTTINPAASKFIEDYSENIAYQKIAEQTGITIDFILPAIGQEQDQFNLMIVSGEYPDLIAHSNLYKGGEFQGMYDGVFRDMSADLPVLAPDYWALIKSDREFYREVSDEEGKMAAVYAYKSKGDPPFQRAILRVDVLEELGLEIPQTKSDYDTMFEAMKNAGITPYMPFEKKGYDEQFIGMFGIMAGSGFFKDAQGELYFGQTRPEFKKYLELMSEWYRKGYISKDFTNVDANQINTLFDTRQIGFTFGPIVANFNRGQSQGFEVTSAPYPRMNLDDQLHYENTDIWPKQGNGAMQVSVAATTEYYEACVRWLNYGYTQEGRDIYNWGVEGVNYDVVAGKKVYNDLMLKNEKFGTEEASYIYKIHFGPKHTELDTICHANLLKSEASLASRLKWADDDKIDSECRLPPYQLTETEQALRTRVMTQVNTYTDEMVLKYITGAESLDTFDTFVSTISEMGLQEVLDSEQAAYERYMEKTLRDS